MKRYFVQHDANDYGWSGYTSYKDADLIARVTAYNGRTEAIIFEKVGLNDPEPIAIWSRQ